MKFVILFCLINSSIFAMGQKSAPNNKSKEVNKEQEKKTRSKGLTISGEKATRWFISGESHNLVNKNCAPGDWVIGKGLGPLYCKTPILGSPLCSENNGFISNIEEVKNQFNLSLKQGNIPSDKSISSPAIIAATISNIASQLFGQTSGKNILYLASAQVSYMAQANYSYLDCSKDSARYFELEDKDLKVIGVVSSAFYGKSSILEIENVKIQSENEYLTEFTGDLRHTSTSDNNQITSLPTLIYESDNFNELQQYMYKKAKGNKNVLPIMLELNLL